jgi:hypothetical protein
VIVGWFFRESFRKVEAMAEETTRIVTGRRGKIFQKDIKKHVARLLHQHCRVKQGELEVKYVTKTTTHMYINLVISF